MNHLDIVWSNQFKKDYKLAMKRHLNIELLDEIKASDYIHRLVIGNRRDFINQRIFIQIFFLLISI